ncbi:MAG: DsbA family protein [Paracoccaceae bacterium]
MLKNYQYLISFFIFIILSPVLHSNEFSVLIEKDTEKTELNRLIKKYILENPEIIIKAIEIYQKKQNLNALENEKKLIKSFSSEIFNDKNSYFFGDKNSKITIVEFIDYNCGYCKKNHKIIMKLLNNENKIRYIIKELPILGESSLLASKIAILIYLTDGAETYKKFFNFLMNHNSQLNFEILKSFARKAGSSIKNFDTQINIEKVNSVILKNLKLAEKLSINGTPSFIIENSIIRGFISFDQLQEIIDNVRKNQ